MRALADLGRPDLVAAIKRHGGVLVVSGRMGPVGDEQAAAPTAAFAKQAARDQLKRFTEQTAQLRQEMADIAAAPKVTAPQVAAPAPPAAAPQKAPTKPKKAPARPKIQAPSKVDKVKQKKQKDVATNGQPVDGVTEERPATRERARKPGRKRGSLIEEARAFKQSNLLEEARKKQREIKKLREERAKRQQKKDDNSAALEAAIRAARAGDSSASSAVASQLQVLLTEIEGQRDGLAYARELAEADGTAGDPLLDAAGSAVQAQQSAAQAAQQMLDSAVAGDGEGAAAAEAAAELIAAARAESVAVREAVQARMQRLTDSLEFAENDVLNARGAIRELAVEAAALRSQARVDLEEVRRQSESLTARLEAARVAAAGRASPLGELIETRVVWTREAEEVSIMGSFNGWTEPVKLLPNGDTGFTAVLHLYPGRYMIKYVVDGDYVIDETQPVVTDEEKNVNNELVVNLE